VIEALVRRGVRLLSVRARDTWNERSFHRFGLEPVYSGVYPTHEAAVQAVPKGGFVGFDDPSIPDFYLHYHFGLNPSDYPVLFWLGKIIQPGKDVFDFGGGVGQCRYAYEPYLLPTGHSLSAARWVVCDLPAFVERGKEVAAEKGISGLRFTTDFQTASESPIFLTNGALQFMHQDLSELLAGLDRLPEHVLVNRVPAYDGPEYFTVQRSRHRSYTPYRVMNRDAFSQRMRALGYRREDTWEVPRTLHVNFRPEYDVAKYQGFYFRREIHAISSPPQQVQSVEARQAAAS
jgi:putative methyltransferase (TIGR04325 family)